MNTKVNSTENRISNLETKLSNCFKRMNDLEETRANDFHCTDDLTKLVKEIDTKLTDSRKSTNKFSDDLHTIKQETLRLAEESLDLQAVSMRDNFLFFNFPESNSFEERRDERCDEKILSFCKDTLKMENTAGIKIDRAHRLVQYTANKTRPIVAKFNFYLDKQNVKQKATAELKK